MWSPNKDIEELLARDVEELLARTDEEFEIEFQAVVQAAESAERAKWDAEADLKQAQTYFQRVEHRAHQAALLCAYWISAHHSRRAGR